MASSAHTEALESALRIQSDYLADGDARAALGALLEAVLRLTGSTAGAIAAVRPAKDGRMVANVEARHAPAGVDGARSVSEPFPSDLIAQDTAGTPRWNPLPDPLRPLLPDSADAPAVALPLAHEAQCRGLLLVSGRSKGYARLSTGPLSPLLRCCVALLHCANGAGQSADAGKAEGTADGDACRLLVERMPQGLAVVQDGRLVFVNAACAALFGHPDGAALEGQDAADALAPRERRDVLRAFLDAQGRGNSEEMNFEGDGLRADGTTLPLAWSAGDTIWRGRAATVLVMHDLSARKAAEEGLRRNRRLLETVFDAFPYHLYVKDRDLRYRIVNRAFARNSSLPPEEMVGRTLGELGYLTPQQQEELNAQDRQVVEEGRPVELPEFRFRLPNGEEVYQTVTKYPLYDEQGQVEGLVGFAMHITERVRAQHEAEAQQRLLRSVLDALPHGVLVKELDGRYMLVNTAFTRALDRPKETILGRRAEGLGIFSAEELERIEATDREVLASGSIVEIPDQVRHTEGGGTATEHVYKAPLLGPDGERTGIVTIAVDVSEEIRITSELQASQRLLRTVLDTIPHSIVVQDPNGRIVTANTTFAQRTGLSIDALTGMPFLQVPHLLEESRRVLADVDRKVLETGQPVEVEVMPGRQLDGSTGYRHVVKAPLTDSEHRVVGIVSIAVDITARVNAERKLQEGQRLLQLIFDTIPHLVSVKDRNGRYVMVNPSYEAVYGVPAASFIGHTPAEITAFSPEARRSFSEEDRRLLSGEVQTLRIAQARPHAGGGERYFDTVKSALLDEHGRPESIVVVALDITERREAEAREALAQARLRDAVENLPAAFMLFDADERLVLWNSRLATFFPEFEGIVHEGMSYAEIAAASAPFNVPEGDEGYGTLRMREFHSHMGPTTHQRSDGRWIQFYDFRTRDGGTVSLRFDVTDLKAREDELRQAHKMEAVGQLTGGVAHDFNNLLTVVLGNLDLLKRKLPGAPDLERLIDRSLSAVERGASLTQRLLAFSRRQTLQARPTDLNELVRGLRELLGRTLGETIAVETHLADDLWPTMIDPMQMENALINLAINARDAMPQGGRLSIETRNTWLDEEYSGTQSEVQPGPYTLVAVSDSGAGVPPELLERVFDPFFTTKETGKGSGLGLSMVYGFVKQSAGHVRLYSEVGKGTTVRLYLPRLVDGSAEPGTAAAQEPLPRGHGERVLIVEDDPHIAQLAHDTLTDLGYATLQAGTAADALALLGRETDVELLFTDVVLPGGLSGIELAEQARRLRPSLGVLYTTGYTEHELMEQSLLRHGALLLEKPYRREELAHMLRRALHGPGTAPTRQPAPAPERS